MERLGNARTGESLRCTEANPYGERARDPKSGPAFREATPQNTFNSYAESPGGRAALMAGMALNGPALATAVGGKTAIALVPALKPVKNALKIGGVLATIYGLFNAYNKVMQANRISNERNMDAEKASRRAEMIDKHPGERVYMDQKQF